MIGEILGDVRRQDTSHLGYKVQQQLGKNAGRRTLLAQDLQTQELVIIKLLLFNSDFEWDDLKLFEREAETLKSLSHPAIPRYLDYFEVNSPTIKGFALVQSYIPAQTLEQYLTAGRTFTETEIKQIAKAILEILIYLHGLYPPVIHRDIKPSNILLGERSGNSVGQVYLVDFGSVQTVLNAEIGTITVVGTYGYMPPEQFGGRTVAASDLYSLGATLIYLVTGNHPADLPQKDFRIQFEQVANLSFSLSYWLKSMTEPNLEKRLSSAKQALTALNESNLQNSSYLANKKITRTQVKLTKIKLHKNENFLEIVIPNTVNLLMILAGFFAILFNSILLSVLVLFGSDISGFSIFSLLVTLFIFGACLSWLYRVVFDLFGQVRLRIDSQQITLNYKLFGFSFYCRQSSLRDSHSISKLVYIPRHFRETAHGQTEEPAKLEIWAGAKKYRLSIPSNRVKTEVEIEWLVRELSDWLGVEIATS